MAAEPDAITATRGTLFCLDRLNDFTSHTLVTDPETEALIMSLQSMIRSQAHELEAAQSRLIELEELQQQQAVPAPVSFFVAYRLSIKR